MPHLSQEQIESANRVDLADFLLSHGERLKNMGSQRLWEKHQVWVDGYRWYSHYDSKGGYAVSFVMRYFDMDFQSAVRELIGEQYTVNDTEPKGYPKKEKQGLEVPPKNATMQRVYLGVLPGGFDDRHGVCIEYDNGQNHYDHKRDDARREVSAAFSVFQNRHGFLTSKTFPTDRFGRLSE